MLPLPILLVGVFAAPHALPPSPTWIEPVMRVGIRVETDAATVSCSGPVRIWRAGSGLAGSAFGPGCAFRLAPSVRSGGASGPGPPAITVVTLRLDACPTGSDDEPAPRVGETLGRFPEELIFEPLDPGEPLEVDGTAYRGEIAAHATAAGALTIVNAVRIEDYLRGVLPLEMGAGETTPPSALQAQAVAARSYALFYLGRRARQRCDLLATTEDQVYGGIPVETPAGTRAVLASRGVVAVYQGRPIRANYCSTCGGMTEASDQAWRGERFPYLRRVRDRDGSGGDLCAASRFYRWKVSWTCGELEACVLRHLPEEVPEARGIPLGHLKDLRIAARSASGRVRVLEVRTEGGTFRVGGDRVRRLVRTPDDAPLRSTLWRRFKRTKADGGTIELEGGGYGHGVGMCQCGALELGRRGVGAEAIVKHYFPNAALTRWWW